MAGRTCRTDKQKKNYMYMHAQPQDFGSMQVLQSSDKSSWNSEVMRSIKKGHALNMVLAEHALQLTSTKPAISEAGKSAKFRTTRSIGEKNNTNRTVIGFIIKSCGSHQECRGAFMSLHG